MASRPAASASASLDTLRVTIVRCDAPYHGSAGVSNTLDVTIDPDATVSISGVPLAVRVFLVIDGVATIIYDDIAPREG